MVYDPEAFPAFSSLVPHMESLPLTHSAVGPLFSSSASLPLAHLPHCLTDCYKDRNFYYAFTKKFYSYSLIGLLVG